MNIQQPFTSITCHYYTLILPDIRRSFRDLYVDILETGVQNQMFTNMFAYADSGAKAHRFELAIDGAGHC